jgi:nucleoid-associated protein YgaU
MKISWTCAAAFVLAGSAALLAPPAARASADVVEHAVVAGDNLHLLAGYYYRDPRQWKRIWKLNRKSLRGPSLLVPGTVLRVELEPGRRWEIPYEEFRSRVRGQ